IPALEHGRMEITGEASRPFEDETLENGHATAPGDREENHHQARVFQDPMVQLCGTRISHRIAEVSDDDGTIPWIPLRPTRSTKTAARVAHVIVVRRAHREWPLRSSAR